MPRSRKFKNTSLDSDVMDFQVDSGETWTVASGGVLNVASGGALQVAGAAITASAAEINKLTSVVAGTASASKAAVLGANKNLDTLVVAAGGLKLGSGAGTAVTAVAAELNKLSGAPLDATFVVGADAGTTVTVNIQLVDGAGAATAVRGSVFAYLSDDANGDSIVATAPSGGWAAGTDGVLIPVVAGKAAHLVSEADGDIDVVITEAGTKNLYLILVMPTGKLVASTVIAFTA
jgi:hypothetical protein